MFKKWMVMVYIIYIIFSLSISIILMTLDLYPPKFNYRKTKIFIFGASCKNSNMFSLFAFTL